MRDKTGGASAGFMDAGKPEATSAAHRRRMEQGGLAGDKALSDYESVSPADGGKVPSGGFLRRNNYDERF